MKEEKKDLGLSEEVSKEPLEREILSKDEEAGLEGLEEGDRAKLASTMVFPPTAYALGADVIKERIDQLKREAAEKTDTPKVLTLKSRSIGGTKLKSSSPPLTPEKLQPEVKEHKDLMELGEKEGWLPPDFPLCTYDDSEIDEVNRKLFHYLGTSLASPFTVKKGPCPEKAHWVVQLDFNNPKSEFALLCTNHFIMLPVQPMGGSYRVFKLHVRNYQRWLRKGRESQ